VDKSLGALEYQVLSALRERINWSRYSHMLNENLFDSNETRHTYKTLVQYHTEHNEDITTTGLKALLYSVARPSDRERYKALIIRIRRNRVRDTGVIETIMRRFCRRQALKRMVLEALDTLEHGEEVDLERVKQRIDEALVTDSMDVGETYNYFYDPLKRNKEEQEEGRIATKISSKLDLALGGGLAPGELALFVAPTGVGKTLALVNVGFGALLQGKKIVHITLEIHARKIARRYDARITGIPMTELKDNMDMVSKRLKKLTVNGAGLQIKDCTARPFSVLDLRAYLERLKASLYYPDLLIVDYADLMYTPRHYKEHRYELTSIITGLRRLASEMLVPVWTASQATREAGKLGRTRLWDIAEDIGKARVADLAIGIDQNELEKDDNVARLRILKTRMGRDNARIDVIMDPDTMIIQGTEQVKVQELRRELRQ
jgi:replicative DNA helicase